MARFEPQGSLKIGNHQIRWFVRHYGGGSSAYAEKHGLSIAVRSDQGKRELHLDFAFEDYFFERPKSDSEFKERLSRCVLRALESNWAPNSRGKPLRISVAELENEK
jgi:hypothetical protein